MWTVLNFKGFETIEVNWFFVPKAEIQNENAGKAQKLKHNCIKTMKQ